MERYHRKGFCQVKVSGRTIPANSRLREEVLRESPRSLQDASCLPLMEEAALSGAQLPTMLMVTLP